MIQKKKQGDQAQQAAAMQANNQRMQANANNANAAMSQNPIQAPPAQGIPDRGPVFGSQSISDPLSAPSPVRGVPDAPSGGTLSRGSIAPPVGNMLY